MPPRRTILRATGWTVWAAATGTGLSACRIRLEDDTPAIPILRRTPIPDEAVFVAAYRRALALADAGTRAAGVPFAAEVTRRHTRQAQVLRALLDAGNVPENVMRGAVPTATSGPSASSSTSTATGAPAVTAQELRALTQAAATESIAAVTAFAEHLSLAVALAAHDAAGAAATGAAVAWPTGGRVPAGVVAPLLEPTRACVYALAVAAAHLPDSDRASALATVSDLNRRERALVADLPAPPPPLGFRLPFAVTDAQTAGRLITLVLANLVDRGLDTVESIPPGSAELVEIARLQAEAVGLAVRHGVPWPTMPGLTLE